VILLVSGIPVEVCKKDIKGMRLYVKPPDGKVMVTAPVTMSNDVIEQFVWTKADWIKEYVDKFKNQKRQISREYVSGETLYLWGKKYNLQVKYGKRSSVVLSDDTVVLTTTKGSTIDQRKKTVNNWYRKLLETEIKQVLPKWEKITNLKVTSWYTRYMTSRWGSCLPKKGRICLNVQLAKKSPECLDYVVLHEIIHLKEKKHNERFKMFMDNYMPEWRKIKIILNKDILDFLEK